MQEFLFNIQDLYKEAELRSLYRARMQGHTTEIPFERLLLTEAEADMMGAYLKIAADEVYYRLQTLMRVEEGVTPYEFLTGRNITYKIVPPLNYDINNLPILYTLVKDYLVEGILKGYYEDTGYDKGVIISTTKQQKQMDTMQTYRIARTKPVRTRHTMI